MSRLEELINEYCPQGVEYKPLGEVVKFFNGRAYKQSELLEEGKYKVLRVGNFHTNEKWYYSDLELDDDKYCNKGDLLYAWAATLGPQIWDGEKVIYHYHIWKLRFDETVLSKRFLYHFLQMDIDSISKSLTNSTMPHISMASMNKRTVPIPPMEVQNEIVRILDNFTELTVELIAELIARKKQYEYYRRQLLTPQNKNAIRKILGDCCSLRAGYAIPSIQISDIPDDEYSIECYGANGHRGYVKYSNQSGNHSLIGRQGALCGNVCYATDDFYATEHAIVVTHDGCFDDRFLFHLLTTAKLNQYKTAGAQPELSVERLEKVEVFIPPMDSQKKIATILDNFESICSDLNIGLPAEIEARKKQYEFYREALLTFAETGSIIDQSASHNSLIRLCQYVFGYVRIELGDVGKVTMCKRIMKAETSTDGDVPFYKIGTFGGQPNAYISKETYEKYKALYSFPKKGDVLISAAGTIGRTVIYDGEPAYYQDSNIVWIDNDERLVLNRYLFYCYQLQPWVASTGGTIARLYNDNISKAKIAIPCIEEQLRIIAILDRFDALCNDITTGLPAEIAARQKQYEYYRDKLLSFKEL